MRSAIQGNYLKLFNIWQQQLVQSYLARCEKYKIAFSIDPGRVGTETMPSCAAIARGNISSYKVSTVKFSDETKLRKEWLKKL